MTAIRIGADTPKGIIVPNFGAFCIRGWLSVLVSHAMENLSAEINKDWPGTTQISDHGWWYSPFSNVPWLTQQCIRNHKAGKKIVLIGHSFGGTAAIMTTQNLNAMGIRVDLLCPIDPSPLRTREIPPNAQRVVGFYEKTPFPLGQGVDCEGKGWTDADWKVRTVDYQLDDTHLQIAADLFVHKTIKDEIMKLDGGSAMLPTI